jgi:hypothetical protein
VEPGRFASRRDSTEVFVIPSLAPCFLQNSSWLGSTLRPLRQTPTHDGFRWRSFAITFRIATGQLYTKPLLQAYRLVSIVFLEIEERKSLMIATTYSHPSERSFAEDELDLQLKPYLNFNGGFFVEAGADDRVCRSPTLYFERYRNWMGLVIEAIPEVATWSKEQRPGCIVENCALVTIGQGHQKNKGFLDSLIYSVKNGRRTKDVKRSSVQIDPHIRRMGPKASSGSARSLTSVLEQHNVSKLDLLSLDLGGDEFLVLQGLDFKKYPPVYILIGARYRDAINRFLAPLYRVVSELSGSKVLYKSTQQIEEESQISINIPVAFFIFNRPALSERVLARIAQARPKTLLVVADGPRTLEEAKLCEETRKIVDRIDWDCEILKDFANENQGCKRRISSGLDWIFAHVEEAIILEDDCLPTISFFTYCQTLLKHYRYQERVFAISGDNFQFGQPRTMDSYYFSRYPHCWGWATWRRAWKYYDGYMSSWPVFKARGRLKDVVGSSMEEHYWTDIFDRCHRGDINSWAYPWTYACWCQNGLTALPDVNLVSNIGFGVNATHTAELDSPLANLPTGNIWRVKHPQHVIRHSEADTFTCERVFGCRLEDTGRRLDDQLRV